MIIFAINRDFNANENQFTWLVLLKLCLQDLFSSYHIAKIYVWKDDKVMSITKQSRTGFPLYAYIYTNYVERSAGI